MKLRTIAYAAAIAVTSTMLVMGSATTGEAKTKKKNEAAPPAPSPAFCIQPYKPVCAVKGAEKQPFTYANACYAARDGAKVISEGPCKAKEAKKAKKKAGKKK